ncbi:MAG: RNA polymerase sigma factor [Bacteroidetes bacterium]|nr:RNA polymerase sigma factor [Bacteroidota bacterium]
MLIDDAIIEGCVAGKRSAQSALYRKFSAVMLAICMRYAQNRDEAEDILQEAFLKIFQNIDSYRKEGSFEGWMKRIMINHALNYYRKNRKLPFLEDIESINETEIMEKDDQPAIHAPLSAEKITVLIQMLPPGYRMVFNMYVFEEYSHKEIAMELGISENTSKTQLLKARRMLKKKIVEIKSPEKLNTNQ